MPEEFELEYYPQEHHFGKVLYNPEDRHGIVLTKKNDLTVIAEDYDWIQIYYCKEQKEQMETEKFYHVKMTKQRWEQLLCDVANHNHNGKVTETFDDLEERIKGQHLQAYVRKEHEEQLFPVN